MEATGADVLRTFIHGYGDRGDLANGIIGEGYLHTFGLKQCLILLGQSILGLLQDADKILPAKRVELNANGKAALELWDQVRGFGDMKRPRCNEQYMVRAH